MALPIFAGPLEDLFIDPDVQAIHVDAQAIRYEKDGVTHESDLAFESHKQRVLVINSIISACGLTLSESNPIIEGELSDGTTVHAEHDPLTLSLYKKS